MDASALTTENIVATIVAGIGIGVITIRQYLKERKAPTSPTGDRIIPGITIADMQPIRDLAGEQAKSAIASERIAVAIEGILVLLTNQARDDEIEDEVERRVKDRLRDRTRRTSR